MDKRLIAETMVDLQRSLLENQLAVVFELMEKLEKHTNETFAMKALYAFCKEIPDSTLVETYFEPMFDEFFNKEVDENGVQ